MNNKIDQIINTSLPPRVGSPGNDAKPAATGNTSSAPDSVRITNDASQLAAVDRALATAQDVNVEKVNTVREAIAGGNYHIDSGVIADKMMQFEQLLGAPS